MSLDTAASVRRSSSSSRSCYGICTRDTTADAPLYHARSINKSLMPCCIFMREASAKSFLLRYYVCMSRADHQETTACCPAICHARSECQKLLLRRHARKMQETIACVYSTREAKAKTVLSRYHGERVVCVSVLEYRTWYKITPFHHSRIN